MKLFLVILSVAGLAVAAPTKDLESDLRDFLDLLPLQDIGAIVQWYAQNDEEVQAIIAYLSGEEWLALVEAVRTHPTFQEFNEYLLERGVDLAAIRETIRDYIDSLGKRVPRRTARSLQDMLDEIRPLIPVDDLLNLLEDKLTNSEDFIDLFNEISSPEAYAFVEEIRYLEETQRLAQRLRELGVDVDRIREVIYAFLGWE